MGVGLGNSMGPKGSPFFFGVPENPTDWGNDFLLLTFAAFAHFVAGSFDVFSAAKVGNELWIMDDSGIIPIHNREVS